MVPITSKPPILAMLAMLDLASGRIRSRRPGLRVAARGSGRRLSGSPPFLAAGGLLRRMQSIPSGSGGTLRGWGLHHMAGVDRPSLGPG